MRVPEGLFVMPSGLTVAVELNGTLGAVTGRYVNGRVGVRGPKPHGVKFVRPEFLVLEDGSPADRGEGVSDVEEEEHQSRTWPNLLGIVRGHVSENICSAVP